MATIKDIAERAGVSRGTVDRVLNGRGEVSRDTKARVLFAVKELDYHPNKAGIALAAQKKPVKLGVCLFGESSPFFDEVIRGVEAKAEEASIYGCSLLVKRLPFDVDLQLRALDELRDQGVSGLLLSPYEDERIREKIDHFAEDGLPVVTVNTDDADSKRIAYVGVNALQSGRTAGQLMGMLAAPDAKVGIITGSHVVLGHNERVRGFRDVLAEQFPGITVVAEDESQDDNQRGYEVTKKMIREHPEINAFLFTTGINSGGCNAIAEASAPGACTVITFDDVPETVDMIKKGIISATICQEPYNQGYRSLGILIDQTVLNTAPEKQENYTDLVIKIRECL